MKLWSNLNGDIHHVGVAPRVFVCVVFLLVLRFPEASSTVRALDRALVSVIITLLNDSERSLNKKWRRPVTNKSNPPNGWKSKQNTVLPSV